MSNPSQQEQVVAILKGDIFELVSKYSKKDKITTEDCKRVFDIQYEDLINYFSINNLLYEYVVQDSTNKEGFHVVKRSNIYETYFVDYGKIFDRETHSNLDSVIRSYVDYLLYGSGLSFIKNR